MHSNGLVFVDVKTDNFMLAPVNGKKSNVAERIRLIDFGLVESINDMTTAKHREDVEGAPLVGTPAYASLNVMSGHTASRRDDLEALGYVICELILNLAKAKKGSKADDNALPWSGAKSDDELLRIKKAEMDATNRSKSKLFSALKACGSDVVMGNYFNSVMSLKYSATPDYDSLRCYLKKLIVTIQSGGSKSETKKAASKSPIKSPLRRKSRQAKRDESDSDDDVVVMEPNSEKKPAAKSPKKQKVATEKAPSRRSTRNTTKSREIATQTDPNDIVDVDESEDDAEVRNMDWEKIESDENEPPPAAARGKACLELDIIEGPHQGKVVAIGGHYNDTIVVGKDPKANSKASTKDAFGVSLPGDESASSLHAKFILTSKKTVHSIKITDMSSTNGTYVNGTALAKGKSKQAFPGDRIKVGDSVFKIRKC
jgi:serine/threonine protein kinase